jgi:hypothetical protein
MVSALVNQSRSGFFSVESIYKDYIYRESVDTLEELKNRLQESIATLTSEMLRNVQNNLLRRATLCIEVSGKQFEHLM